MHAQANAATPAAAPAGGAEWRARLEASHRAEAVALAAEPVWEPPESEADETGEARPVPGQCPRCRARVNVGVTVAIRHRPGCAVAAVKAAVRARARRTGRAACPPETASAACQPAPPLAEPAEAPCAAAGTSAGTPQIPDVRPAVRHRNRRRGRDRVRRSCGAYSSRLRAGIRPGLVARWFVSGTRVLAEGLAGTARRLQLVGGQIWAAVDLDGWPGTTRWFTLFDLARCS